jgi:hypothetical protein
VDFCYKPGYRADLVRDGERFIPAARVIGRLVGPRACSEARQVIAAAFNLATADEIPVIDLIAVTGSELFFAGTVATAIVERLDHGGSTGVLVIPGELANQLIRLLPQAVVRSVEQADRRYLELCVGTRGPTT